jgi:quercetin dioxygenase-like cupin family protein
MKSQSLSFTVLLALPLALLAAQSSPPSAGQSPEHAPTPAPAAAPAASMHVAYNAADLKWGAAPDAFEPGAKSVVLSGDPGKPGLFVIRLKVPAGYKVANHWHPTDEHVTLLDGDVALDMDDGAEKLALSSGAYVLLPAHMHHAVSTRTGATVQISAMGPFALTYVDPKDDPRKQPH